MRSKTCRNFIAIIFPSSTLVAGPHLFTTHVDLVDHNRRHSPYPRPDVLGPEWNVFVSFSIHLMDHRQREEVSRGHLKVGKRLTTATK